MNKMLQIKLAMCENEARFFQTRTLLIITLCTITNLLLSQKPYIPLIDSTKEWHCEKVYFTEDGYAISSSTIGIRFRGDTIIDGRKYSFLELCTNDSLFENWEKSHEYIFREDTLSKKVFLLHNYSNYSNEKLIYDFSLEVGDSLKINYDCILDSVSIATIANKNRTIQYIRPIGNYVPEVVIEGI